MCKRFHKKSSAVGGRGNRCIGVNPSGGEVRKLPKKNATSFGCSLCKARASSIVYTPTPVFGYAAWEMSRIIRIAILYNILPHQKCAPLSLTKINEKNPPVARSEIQKTSKQNERQET